MHRSGRATRRPGHTILIISLLLIIGTIALATAWGYTDLGGRDNPYGHTPITIYVTGDDGHDEYALQGAIAHWEQSYEPLTFSPTFEFVDTATGADIHITFTNTSTVTCGPPFIRVEAAGCGGIIAGTGYANIATRGHSLTATTSTTAHELGHALGLFHTTDESSIMHTSLDGYPWYIRWLNHPWGNYHTK